MKKIIRFAEDGRLERSGHIYRYSANKTGLIRYLSDEMFSSENAIFLIEFEKIKDWIGYRSILHFVNLLHFTSLFALPIATLSFFKAF